MTGILAKKCARCTRVRHPCVEITEPAVIKAVNKVYERRDGVADARLQLRTHNPEVDEETEEELRERLLRAETAFRNASADLKQVLGAQARNQNKTTGGVATPRKGGAGAAPAASDPFAEQTFLLRQSIDRSLRAIVECLRLVSTPRPACCSRTNECSPWTPASTARASTAS